jgi:hypothetical protein
MSEMKTLVDALPDGIARVTEILGHYTAIGPADAFGAMMIHASLGRATRARRPRYRRDADRARRLGGIQRMIAAYPLQWPAGRSCTKRQQIKNGNSRRNGKWLTVFDGVERVLVSSSSSASEQDIAVIQATYKRAASAAHPDKGGSRDAMTELNAAPAAAEKELGAK